MISSGRSFIERTPCRRHSGRPALPRHGVVVRKGLKRWGRAAHRPAPSSWRRRSNWPRTLASRRSEPACRTMPPIRSGSTLRVACTLRPDLRSMSARMRLEVRVGELVRGRHLDAQHVLLARSTSASNSAATSRISPARPFSASRRDELRTSAFAPASTLRDDVDLDGACRSPGRRAARRARAPRRARRRGRRAPRARPRARPAPARPRRARGHRRGVRAAMSGSPPARRSRSRRAPRRSGAAGRRSVSVLRVIFSAASSERLATSRGSRSSACLVACSIWRRVSSSRRWRSSSVSSRMRSRWASAILRASARIDSASLRACADQRAVLLEQAARLLAGVVGLLDRQADALAAVVDQLLDRAEGVALEHPERDREGDQRPDHQARDDLDQGVGGDQHRLRRGRSRAGRRGSRRTRRPR